MSSRQPSDSPPELQAVLFALACLGTMLLAAGFLLGGDVLPGAEILGDTTISAATATAALMVIRT